MSISTQDLELEKYFTDVETLRGWFAQAIVAPTLPKRLLVIWGVGGIGKSSVLRMFRLNCKSANVPVALASGDEAKSAVDVLTRWSEDLKSDGVNLPQFSNTLGRFHEIQAKVENKSKDTREKVTDVAGKAASKTAEALGGAALGAAFGSVVPGIGTVAGAVFGGVAGGMGAEALVDYLRSFLPKPDVDLLLDPTKKLTEDFLTDMNHVSSKQRLVLMLDTYEQMTTLDAWTLDLAQGLKENVLLVIAGRAMVDWGRSWSSWLMHAEVQELKPMTKRVMHELIRKYYATMRGGEPDSKQVDAIIEFARGLPVVINMAVHLWVQYGEDFQSFKPRLIQELVMRFREGVPSELHSLLDTTASLRYFNTEILRTVSGRGDIKTAYEQLRRFPFVRVRAEGLALHDAVRDILEESMRIDDPAKYRGLHERAEAYFEARLANATGQEEERLGLERLYHCVCADEDSGIRLFQEMADSLVRYRLISQLRTLLNDVNKYPIERENNKLWREYYNARIAQFEIRLMDVVNSYERISENHQAAPKLQAYALRDLGNILMRTFNVTQPASREKAITILERAWKFKTVIGTDAIPAILNLAGIYSQLGNYAAATKCGQEGLAFSQEKNDSYAKILCLESLRTISGIAGNWKEMISFHKLSIQQLDQIGQNPYLKSKIMGGYISGWIYMGGYSQAEEMARTSIDARKEIGDPDLTRLTREAGFAKGIQEKFQEAQSYFSTSLDMGLRTDDPRDKITKSVWGRVLTKHGELKKAEELLLESLQSPQIFHDSRKIEVILWIAELNEVHQRLKEAEHYYHQAIDETQNGRSYFDCAKVVGLTRVHHAQQNYTAIAPLFQEAEHLAQQYEYIDHLASLRLTQGHIAAENKTFEVFGDLESLHDTLYYYQQSLIYALRFNRFLLDEVLSGRPQGTPLHPIIPECLKRGEEGQKMLLALRNWWQTGINDIGTSRPDTISPIPENITLLDAEKIAREREPGDGSLQRTVLEQLESALLKP